MRTSTTEGSINRRLAPPVLFVFVRAVCELILAWSVTLFGFVNTRINFVFPYALYSYFSLGLSCLRAL